MNCNWVRERLSNYVDGMLDECSLEKVESHVHECESCKAELALLKKMLATMSTVADVEPPVTLRAAIKDAVSSAAREECERVEMLLSEYVDGALPDADRSLVEKHLTACLDCSYQLAAMTNALELARSVEQVEPPANLRERILVAIETAVNRGALGRALDHAGAMFRPAPARWAAAGLATAAIAAAIIVPFRGNVSQPPLAKNPVPVTVREQTPNPAVVAQKPTAPAAPLVAQVEHPRHATRLAIARNIARPTAKQAARIASKPVVVARVLGANTKIGGTEALAAKSEKADQPVTTAKSGEAIAEQVRETVAKINTEIAAEKKAEAAKEEPKVITIAVVRRKPTDQIFTFEDLKEQLAKQRKPEQKSSVTIIGSKF